MQQTNKLQLQLGVQCLPACCAVLQVNNAGILIGSKWDQQSYDSTLAVNATGPVALSQALLPSLPPGALIIMVSSGGWV